MHEIVYPFDKSQAQNKDDEIVLVCSPLFFFSQNDEDLMFAWLDKVKSIKGSKGNGRELRLFLNDKNIPLEDLWDLMGVFTRYNFDYSQLEVFKTKENEKWYRR